MRYSGTKFDFSDKFNGMISNISSKVYYEPFVGGGAIYANLPHDTTFSQSTIDEFHINDLDENIMGIWEFIKRADYYVLDEISKFIKIEFGDIKSNKESHYAYRDYYNKTYHFTDNTHKGGYLYFLVNSCINSFARFGTNGFNQSFGNRYIIYTDIEDEYADKFFNKRFIRDIKSAAPTSTREIVGREVVYTNF